MVGADDAEEGAAGTTAAEASAARSPEVVHERTEQLLTALEDRVADLLEAPGRSSSSSSSTPSDRRPYGPCLKRLIITEELDPGLANEVAFSGLLVAPQDWARCAEQLVREEGPRSDGLLEYVFAGGP